MTSNRILIKKSKVSLSQPPRVIGRGAMGEVYLANYQGRNVVVKKSQRDIDILLKEYSNYFKLQNHNNILKFHGVIRDDRYSFSLVLEYAPHGNLSSYLKTHTVGWNAKARICRDVALGLMYCHDNNVLHFDLKPENILLDKDLVPKLADFGISKTKSQMVLDHGKAGGTLNYVAPERVCIDLKMREFFEKHPKLSDIYSYGLILWSVAKDGEHPYEGIGDDEIREQKRSSHSIHRLLDQLPADTPQIYNQLIYDMTTYNPSERRQLTFAVLELESLFDDDDDDDDHQVKSNYYGDSLPLDDLDSSDDDRDTSSNPVSTVTTIESERSTLASDIEINDYNEKSETTSSYKIQNRPLSIESNVYRLLVAKGSSMSSNDGVPPPNLPSNDNNVNGNKILDREVVASPSPISSNGDRNNLMGVEIPSPSLDSISNYSLSKRDSDIKTLVGSPTNIKSPPFEEIPKISDADQELMDGVNSIFENWEKYTDDVMRRKLENLCYDKKIKAKDLFAVFENNPSKSADYYFAMGFMNEHAFGKPKDPKAAFEYYSKAAELDHPRGLVFIGWCYYKGMGTPKDPQKAFDSFQRAADNGCISAHNNVGWCYDIGFGTYTDPYKAFECFKASAEKGYATAQCRVGVCYEYGRGTIKDLERALEWYTKAANNGHETAKRRVSELSKLIRRDGRRRSFLERVLYGPLRSKTA